jgi:hypothetical protein
MVVFEYASNGTLYEHLHCKSHFDYSISLCFYFQFCVQSFYSMYHIDYLLILLDGEDGSHLSWIRRMKVAIGIAKGLRYLHTELQPPYALANLNSNAVYVTEEFTPKVLPLSLILFFLYLEFHKLLFLNL